MSLFRKIIFITLLSLGFGCQNDTLQKADNALEAIPVNATVCLRLSMYLL